MKFKTTHVIRIFIAALWASGSGATVARAWPSDNRDMDSFRLVGLETESTLSHN